jgi:hypothetical protein
MRPLNPSGKLAVNSKLMQAQAKIHGHKIPSSAQAKLQAQAKIQAKGPLTSKTPTSTSRRLKNESVKKTTGSRYVGSGLGKKLAAAVAVVTRV